MPSDWIRLDPTCPPPGTILSAPACTESVFVRTFTIRNAPPPFLVTDVPADVAAGKVSEPDVTVTSALPDANPTGPAHELSPPRLRRMASDCTGSGTSRTPPSIS